MRFSRVLAIVAIAAVGVSAAQFTADSQALLRLVATERAFAAATAELGIRDAFLTFFADDAVQIRRDPVVTLASARAALLLQPPPRLPLDTTLTWQPFTGNVSGDGTLGWLTGPYALTSQTPPTPVRHGAFFSVWTRQPNGTWRVWLDEGVELPRAWQDASPFRPAATPDPGTTGSPNETIEDAERTIATNTAAWRDRLAATVRLHAHGEMPLVGRDDVVNWSAARAPQFALMRTQVAGSVDLAVTIGALTEPPRPQPGSWVRVWARDVNRRWRIVFETRH